MPVGCLFFLKKNYLARQKFVLNTCFFNMRKPPLCLNFNFHNIMLEIRLRFSLIFFSIFMDYFLSLYYISKKREKRILLIATNNRHSSTFPSFNFPCLLQRMVWYYHGSWRQKRIKEGKMSERVRFCSYKL